MGLTVSFSDKNKWNLDGSNKWLIFTDTTSGNSHILSSEEENAVRHWSLCWWFPLMGKAL